MAGENMSSSRVSDVNMEVRDLSLPSPLFDIEVEATFFIMDGTPPALPNGMLVEAGRFISHVLYQFPLEALINNGDAHILDMLNSMRVPVQPFMVEEIASSAVYLATAARDHGSTVLSMKVEIEAAVNDVPFGNDDDDIYTDDEGPATAEEMAQNVREVVVEGPGTDCPICLEEFVVGSTAACMRCSHVFHTPCIEAWLNIRIRCPCCRFMLSI